jgi:ComEC/Rec2-related protein
VVAAVALALVRGLTAGCERGDGPAEPSNDGVVMYEILGASVTGSRCEVAVRRGAGYPTAWLVAPPEACPLAQGQTIAVPVTAHRPSALLPGDPDPRDLVRGRGAHRRIEVRRAFPAGGTPEAYWGFVARARDRAWTLSRGDEGRAFVVASTLGIRTALDPGQRSALRDAGLGHLIAVSGMHVAVAAWAVYHLFVRLSVRLVGRVGPGIVLSWLPVLGYVGLTGASPPAVRAAMMLGLFGLGIVVARPTHGFTLLAVAATWMLLVRPAWALDPGFQLSMAAMAALVRAPAGAGLVRQTWRVTWAVLPIALLHFGQSGGWAVLANLVAVPVFTAWVMPVAVVGWLLMPWVGSLGLDAASAGAAVILDVAAALAALPDIDACALAIVATAILIAYVMPRRWQPRWLIACLPPAVAAAGTVVAILIVAGRPATIPIGSWYAIGTDRSAARVAVVDAPNTEQGAVACIVDPTLAAGRWPRLLHALGIQRVALIRDADGESQAPHVDALRRHLRAKGLWTAEAVPCVMPDPKVVRNALRACMKRVGRGPVVIAGGDGVLCYERGSWQKLESAVHHAPQ